MSASRKWFQNNKTPSESRYLRDLVANFRNLLKFLKNLHWARRYSSSKLTVFRKILDLTQDLSLIWVKIGGKMTKTWSEIQHKRSVLVRLGPPKHYKNISEHNSIHNFVKTKFLKFSFFFIEISLWTISFRWPMRQFTKSKVKKKIVRSRSPSWMKVRQNCATFEFSRQFFIAVIHGFLIFWFLFEILSV